MKSRINFIYDGIILNHYTECTIDPLECNCDKLKEFSNTE